VSGSTTAHKSALVDLLIQARDDGERKRPANDCAPPSEHEHEDSKTAGKCAKPTAARGRGHDSARHQDQA